MTVASSLVRKDWMTVLRLSGTEARSWLQGMVTNEVEKLLPGEGCYAGHLTAQGKLVAQMIILALEDAILLLVETAAASKLATVFDRLIVMEDVQVQDLSSEYRVLGCFGSQSLEGIAAWSGRPLVIENLYAHQEVQRSRILRTEIGFDLIVARDERESVEAGLMGAGFSAAERSAWELERIEAGIPVYGVDVDETTVLPELGGRGISYDKGCYIGQEVVARIKYLGHVNRKFVGFVCEGSEVPDQRSAVQRQGKEVGYTTSSVFSPRVGHAIALGFVGRAAAEPGMEVVLLSEGKNLPARVAALPFDSAKTDA